MAVPITPPLVVPKTRFRTLGGDKFASVTQQVGVEVGLGFDIVKQGTADIQWMLRSISARDTGEQIRLGNPPQVVTVDDRPARAFDDAQRRVDVLFGTKLAQVAMRMIEQELRRNIERTTNKVTGRLANVGSYWRWRLITPGKGSQVVTASTELPAFTRGTVLVLEPIGVPYATRVNSLVTGSGALRSRRQRGGGIRKGQFGPPKPKQPIGYLRATAEALRSRSQFRNFSVSVVFSRQHAVPGELSRKQGTGAIVVQLKRATAR